MYLMRSNLRPGPIFNSACLVTCYFPSFVSHGHGLQGEATTAPDRSQLDEVWELLLISPPAGVTVCEVMRNFQVF